MTQYYCCNSSCITVTQQTPYLRITNHSCQSLTLTLTLFITHYTPHLSIRRHTLQLPFYLSYTTVTHNTSLLPTMHYYYPSFIVKFRLTIYIQLTIASVINFGFKRAILFHYFKRIFVEFVQFYIAGKKRETAPLIGFITLRLQCGPWCIKLLGLKWRSPETRLTCIIFEIEANIWRTSNSILMA